MESKEDRQYSVGVHVSPDQAREWLSSSKGNRNLKQSTIDMLVREILADRWKPGASVIRFDEDGCLIDGHHRLTAVMKSGKTVLVDVARGVSSADSVAIDVGVSRSMVDIMTMRGGRGARFFVPVVNGVRISQTARGERLSVDQYEAIENALLPITREEMSSLHHACKNHRIPRPGFVAGILTWLLRTHPELQGFASDVSTLSGRDRDPSKVVSNYLLKLPSSMTITNADEIVSRVCYGARAAIAGKGIAFSKSDPDGMKEIREIAKKTWWPL